VAGKTRPARPVITEEVRYKNDESDKQPAPGLADADYWDTSTAVVKGKESGKAGTEYEIHTGYKSEYLFRGRELGEDSVPQITTRSVLSADEAVAEAQRLRKAGKYDEARDTLEDVLSRAPGNQQAGDELAMLDGPLRTNPALTYEHTQNVDGVRRGLEQAEGKINLGKFDDAKREYEDVLRKDPYNNAARRGMEKIAAAKSDCYRAAYDHTRAELLAEVDNAWESAVPAEAKETDGFINYGAPIAGNKKDLSIPDDAVALAKAVRDQEDKVEERRKVLATIVRTKGIIYKGQDSFYNQAGVDEDQSARNALEVHHELQQEKLQLESQIGSLLKYDSDQLMVYAAGLDQPDNIIRNLYPQYQEAKRKLDADKAKGMGDKHPTVQATVDQVEAMKRQLDEGVINLRATLQAQLELATNRLKSVEAMKNQTREMAIKRGLDAQDYADAKKEFEKDLELLQQMKLKLMAATIKAKPEPPKPDLAKLMEEIPASEDPYSTFSLNISDASFQVAQAALAKGEQPDPAGIKVEQFYNAVDYGDPAPSAGEPVAVSIEQAAHPVIPGRNLVRIALKTAAAGRSASQPLRLTLLVDQSGSMVRADRRAAMDKALAGLSELLTANDLVTVIGFSRTPRLLADGMTGDNAEKLAALVNQAASEGGTNLEEAIKLGEQMADRRKLAGAQNRIVLLTDGAANLGNADPERLALKVEQLRQKGIAFDIAGIAADGLNDELLGELSRKGNGRYYVVGKGADNDFAKQLAGAFRPAAENVKVQVRFNPERVARYRLIGFEKDRLKTEDFRNDRVDAAELAAEEAGVAIYQVEPMPEGSGELGEVSVRFRDTASGGMVERTWTIPHEPGVPAIDRATPSMQLAVLAMFAGEKLRGGPLAEAIDFQQLAVSQANVKQSYGSNARVAEVLRMVEMLK
jgi:secreted protein with Ig-like and vWFA domain